MKYDDRDVADGCCYVMLYVMLYIFMLCSETCIIIMCNTCTCTLSHVIHLCYRD